MILFFVCFGAGFIHSQPYCKPAETADLCEEGQDSLITSIDKAIYIYLEEQPKLKIEHYPYFRLPYVRQYIPNTASIEIFLFTDAIDKPTAIIRGINLYHN